jgi:RHS repeat-associated protein
MYYHADGLGSIRAITDPNGDAVITYDYDVFGEPRFESSSSPNYFRFTGEQFDASTSLYNLRAWYYAPWIGRFPSAPLRAGMSRDPSHGLADTPQSQRPYPRVINSPTNKVDPPGLTRRSGIWLGGALF